MFVTSFLNKFIMIVVLISYSAHNHALHEAIQALTTLVVHEVVTGGIFESARERFKVASYVHVGNLSSCKTSCLKLV